jgi:hypothetical protein
MVIALAAVVMLQASPEKVMHAHWDKMAAAKSLYVEGRVRGAKGGKDFLYFAWLEKPDRARSVAKNMEVRRDGSKQWTIDHDKKTYTISTFNPEFDVVSPAFAPFFGNRSFSKAEAYDEQDWSKITQGRPRLIPRVRLMAPASPGRAVYLDPKTCLPTGDEVFGNASNYPSYVLKLVFDKPHPGFKWPSLEGYTLEKGQ